MIVAAGPSWNPIADLQEMLSFPFMVNAFRAGSIVAVLAGVMGYLMVLRRQSFVGHTLSLVGFPGAAGAVLLGLPPSYGYFAFCVAGALAIAAWPGAGHRGYQEESAVTATVQCFALACGLLFAALYHGYLSGINALLFGNFLGITTAQLALLGLVATLALLTIGLVARPLVFASLDPDVARARNVPVRWVSALFLVLLGAATAEASQITGSLLVFALLVMPAASAQALTARPARALFLATAIGLTVTWVGLGVAFYTPYPVGFLITSFAFAGFVAARAAGSGWIRRRTGGQGAGPGRVGSIR